MRRAWAIVEPTEPAPMMAIVRPIAGLDVGVVAIVSVSFKEEKQ